MATFMIDNSGPDRIDGTSSTSHRDEVDVAIVGSGVAGLGAAIEAAQAGARTVIFEGQATVGGASVMSGAACCLVDTALQKEHGITDTVDLAVSDWAATGGPTADLQWGRRYLYDSNVEVYQWCGQLGIRWVSLAQPEGNSVPRWHTPEGWGRAIVEAMLQRATALGVDVRTNNPVTRLLTDHHGVCGLETSYGETLVETRAAAVIICSGGFAANHEMVLSCAPHLQALPRLLSGGAPTALGHGHRLLSEAGAAMTHLDHIWVYPNGTPDPTDPAGQRGLGVRGPVGEIWLNQAGERFHDETLRGGRSGTQALLRQPGQTAWSIFTQSEVADVLLIDNEYFSTPAGAHARAMNEFWNQSRYAWRADNPTELATAIGLPPVAVQSTIEELDAAISSGAQHDPRFGRPLVGVAPMAEQPLAAIQLFPMAQKNFGGVRTDLDCRVLTAGEEPIAGLYAAGEVAGMAGGCINGRAALEGTMFGPCLYSGRLAGLAATADLTVLR